MILSEAKPIVLSLKEVNKQFRLLGFTYLFYLICIIILRIYYDDLALYLKKFINLNYESLLALILTIGILIIGLLLFNTFKKLNKLTNHKASDTIKLRKIPYIQLTVLATALCLLGTFFTSFFSTIAPLEITLMFPIGVNILDFESMNIFLFILIVIASPIIEEYIFRGVTLRFLGRFSNRFGIISVSLLFSIYHLDFVQLFPAFILSCFLCLFTLRYKTIVPAIIVRIITNFILLFLTFIPASNYMYLIVFIILLYLTAIITIFTTYKKRVILPYEPDSNLLLKLLFKRFTFIIIFLIIICFNVYRNFIL